MLAEARREQAKLGIFPTAAPKASSKGWQAMPGAPALVRYLEVFFFFQKQPPMHFVLWDSFCMGESTDEVSKQITEIWEWTQLCSCFNTFCVTCLFHLHHVLCGHEWNGGVFSWPILIKILVEIYVSTKICSLRVRFCSSLWSLLWLPGWDGASLQSYIKHVHLSFQSQCDLESVQYYYFSEEVFTQEISVVNTVALSIRCKWYNVWSLDFALWCSMFPILVYFVQIFLRQYVTQTRNVAWNKPS